MKLKPWKHQLKEYKEGLDIPARAMLWGMRTGKTKPVIDQMCFKYLVDGLNGGLVLAPNGVHVNWTKREMPKHMWEGIDYMTLPWISSKSSRKYYQQQVEQFMDFKGFRLLAVNYQALRIERTQKLIKKFLKECKGRVALTADESHHLGRPGSRQSSLTKALAKRCEMRRLLSGTAILNSPLQAYSQYNCLEPGALGFTRFDDFKAEYAVYVQRQLRSGKTYPHLDHYRNLEELRERMAVWSSVVLREDVDDMPELLLTDRACMLSDKQIKAYLEMQKYTLTVDNETVTARENAGRLTKFQQILGGFVYDARGDVVNIDADPPRLQALVEEAVGTLPGKFIVWCRFTEDIRRVVERLKKEGLHIVQFHGKMTESAKEDALDRFQTDPTVNGVVGQPKSGGEGRDFSMAEAIINYSHSHDAITRNQSIERGTEKGGGSVAVVDLYTPGTVEEDVLKCLVKKESVSNMVAGTGLRDLLLATSI